jgi:hypothetical protein
MTQHTAAPPPARLKRGGKGATSTLPRPSILGKMQMVGVGGPHLCVHAQERGGQAWYGGQPRADATAAHTATHDAPPQAQRARGTAQTSRRGCCGRVQVGGSHRRAASGRYQAELGCPVHQATQGGVLCVLCVRARGAPEPPLPERSHGNVHQHLRARVGGCPPHSFLQVPQTEKPGKGGQNSKCTANAATSSVVGLAGHGVRLARGQHGGGQVRMGRKGAHPQKRIWVRAL